MNDTLYLALYSLTTAECASKILCPTMYVSFEELPQEHLVLSEQRPGAMIPCSYPATAKILASLTVVQYKTLLPNSLKHTSAYAVKSFLNHKHPKFHLCLCVKNVKVAKDVDILKLCY